MNDYLDDNEEVVVESKIPIAENFFLKTHLYEKYTFDIDNESDVNRLIDLEFFNDAIQCYCHKCNEDRTFRNDRIKSTDIRTASNIHKPFEKDTPHKFKTHALSSDRKTYLKANKVFTLEFYCTHQHNHRIYFTFCIDNNTIQKIGQYPTILDLENNSELNTYKKELGTEKGREFHKAIGLASHGIGVGSFVYLRRIFEDFIFQAKDEAVKNGEIKEENFKDKRMNERIELLSNYLPDTLVEHKEFYGIVSKGIHELTEDECLSFFDTLKIGIEVILDEKIERKKKEAKRKDFKQNIIKVHQSI